MMRWRVTNSPWISTHRLVCVFALVSAVALSCTLLMTPAMAAGKKKDPGAKSSSSSASAKKKRMAKKAAPKGTPAQQYCVAIRDHLADTRMLWRVHTMKKMEDRLQKRIAQLEEKTREYKEWLAKRNAFAARASKSLINIYSKMRPDAAAVQLAILDDHTAASILTKLKPRTAGTILAEMKPARAARLSTTIAGAAKTRMDDKS